MRTKAWRGLFVGLLLPLGAMATLQAQSSQFFGTDRIPHYNIPHTDKAPVIDGTINQDEWRQAVKIMGLATSHSTRYVDRPHAFYMAWDAQHLYIAGRAHILKDHVLLKSRREKYTTGVVYDDAFEFGLSMMGRNQLPGEVESYFKFILNSIGSGEYMKNYPEIGQMMFNWTPDFKIANQLHPNESGSFWEIELAMDLKDLQMPMPNQVGDKVKTLLATDLKNPGWEFNCFPSATGHLIHTGFPVGELTEKRPYIQIDQLGGFEQKQLTLQTVLYNPAPTPAKVQVNVLVDSRPTKPKQGAKPETAAPAVTVIHEEQILTIPANGHLPFERVQSFEPHQVKRGSFEFRVTLPDKNHQNSPTRAQLKSLTGAV